MQETIIDSKYQIVRLLGRGGMGAVYEAKHLGTSRRVALKVIVPEALASGSDIVPRFQREARASGAIDSQHVVQVLDTGVDPATKSPYLVMEYLRGEDVLQLIQRLGPLPVDIALRLMAQACAGIDRAHAAGIIHRDIKSANLFVAHREDDDVVVKILDFGIAKVRIDPLTISTNPGITRAGALLGSPLYMAPEQLMGGTKELPHRADIFSLGVTMYEMLSGNPPNYDLETIGRLVHAICQGTAPTIQQRAPWVPDEVAAIVAKALAVDPDARYQTAAEMRAAILTLLPQGSALQDSMLAAIPPRHDPGANGSAGTLVVTPPPILGPTRADSVPRPIAMPMPMPIPTQTPMPSTAPLLPPAQPPVAPPYHAATGTVFSDSNQGAAPPIGGKWLPTIASFVIVFALGCTGLGIWVLSARAKTGPDSQGPDAAMSVRVMATTVKPPPPTDTLPSTAESKELPPPFVTSPPDAVDAAAGPTPRPRPTPPPTPTPTPKQGPLPKPGCTPNYYFKDGIKIFKEECL